MTYIVIHLPTVAPLSYEPGKESKLNYTPMHTNDYEEAVENFAIMVQGNCKKERVLAIIEEEYLKILQFKPSQPS